MGENGIQNYQYLLFSKFENNEMGKIENGIWEMQLRGPEKGRCYIMGHVQTQERY